MLACIGVASFLGAAICFNEWAGDGARPAPTEHVHKFGDWGSVTETAGGSYTQFRYCTHCYSAERQLVLFK